MICFSCFIYSHLGAQAPETIDRLRNKAEKLYSQGEYAQALNYYLSGYQLARQSDKVRAANLTVDISSIYHMRGDYQRAVAICHEGVRLLTQATVQPDSVWFKLNSSLGEMYKKLNSQDSCYLYFSQANAILQKHPELETRIAAYVIYHYNNQGMMYVRDGGYTEGLSYLTKALFIAEKQTTAKEDIAILQNNLGELYEGLGLFQKALGFRELALKNYSKKDVYVCQIYNGLAKDALQNKLYTKAAGYAREAIALSKRIAHYSTSRATTRALILAYNCLGECAYSTGTYLQADDYFNTAVQQHKRFFGERSDLISSSYLGLARTLQSQGQLESALSYCQQAIQSSYSTAKLSLKPTLEQALSEPILFEAFVLKAELLFLRFNSTKKLNDLNESYAAYEHAIAVADAMRKSYNALETKWFFATQVRSAYLSAIKTAYTLYNQTKKPADKERVFSLLERSKAAALADLTRESLIKPANVPVDLLTRERALQRTISAQKLELTGTPSPKLIDAQIQLAQLQQRFEKEFPAYYQAKYQSQSVSITQLQTTLDGHTAYLSYLVAHDALYIAVVTHDELTIVQKNGDIQSLTGALKTLDAALYTNPGFGNYTGTSTAIIGYRWLIEPLSHLLKNKERLLVSPDGDLHRLPFDVLETGRIVDDFLIKHYAISYVPSAIALIRGVNTMASNPKNNLISLAPFVEPGGTKPPVLPLPYLPASQAEVEQLPGEALLGKAATKSRFMRSYLNYDIIHLATHAYANDTEPARSYIAFYPDGNPDRLYAGEIYNLSLTHTRLVILSACETGNGKLQPGEGVMSLAQAFIYAGCSSVVSTLWNANDESTAYLTQQVYKHLQAGLPIDVALQRTRLDYFQSDLYPKLNHPHYWANLVLIGTNQPVYDTPWPVMGVMSIVIGFLLAAGLVIWQLRLPRNGMKSA